MQPFSIMMPVYNEEDLLVANTEKLIAHLETLGSPFEILIASNGSTDATVEKGQWLEQTYPRVHFFHTPQRGPGQIVRQVLPHIAHPIVLFLDADLSTDLSFVPKALHLMDNHDIVIGSKKSGQENRSLIRRLGSDGFIWLSTHLLRLPFNDYSLGAKAYRTDILQRYVQDLDRWTFFVQHIIYHAYNDGYDVTQIPILCQDFRQSRFKTFRNGGYRFWNLFRLAVSSWGRGRTAPGTAPQEARKESRWQRFPPKRAG